MRTTTRWFTMALVAGTLMLALAQTTSALVSATGGNATNDIGGYRIHTFTNSATASNLVVTVGGNVEVLVVAGGGGGGYEVGGGGGAGGMITNASFSVSPGSLTVTVGEGGAGGTVSSTAQNGSTSVFSTITATGGGGAGNFPSGNGANGGSGGGGAGYTSPGGPGSTVGGGQGNNGGAAGSSGSGTTTGSGGGGAGGVGGTGVQWAGGFAAGGVGLSSSISGAPVTYATGGRGGADSWAGAVDSAANTGNGGDGAGSPNDGKAGGSGIVIVKYLLPVQPVIQNLSATNVTATSAWLNGYVADDGGAAIADVAVYWGTTDGGSPTSGLWTTTNTLAGGPWSTGASLTHQAAGLTSNASYYYRYYAANASGPAWAPSTEHVLAGGNVTVTNTDPLATRTPSGPPDTGTLAIQRDPTATNDALTVYFVCSGTAVQNVDYTLSPAGSSITLAAGAVSTNITITPLWGYGAKTVWLTVLPRGYTAGSPASNYVAIADYVYASGANATTNAGNWTDDAIWSLSRPPLAGDDVTVKHAVVLRNATDHLNSFTITNATLTFTNWNTTLTASNVTVQSGGMITLPAAFTNNQMSNNVTIVCTNLTIDLGGSINVDSNGYAGGSDSGKNGNGPGAGLVDLYNGGGGGHGGRGGNGYSSLCLTGLGGTSYDEASNPVAPGSGGAWGQTGYPGGHGGGAVRIRASELVTVNGTITARGASTPQYCGGGGAGGSIYITCRTFSGNNGVVNADGGSVYPGTTVAGGGGGGRIAVIYDTSAQTSVPAVQFSALPGTGWRDGVLGTVYFPGAQLMAETPNINGRVVGFSTWSPNNLTLNNVWMRFVEDGFQLTVTNNLVVNGSSAKLDLGGNAFSTNLVYMWNTLAHLSEMTARPGIGVGGNLILTNGGSLTVFASVTNASVVNYGAFVGVAGTLFVAGNSFIYPYSQPTNGGSVLFRVGNLVVSAPNAGFDADKKGYLGSPVPMGVNGYGPGGGSGITYYGGGGGYGGQGGDGYWGGSAPGGGTYGNSNAPAGPGSGGGGSGGWTAGTTLPGCAGGGLVWIEAANAIMLNGTITASGGSDSEPLPARTYGAGGSGGGVLLRCKAISGTGVVTANGGFAYNSGSGNGGGGGGGGRIAVWTSSTNQFTGTASAMNGTGLNPGAPGTIVWFLVPPPGMVITIR